jgi:Ca-activated chloride channel family protein
MVTPKVELIPLRSVVASDASVSMTVLIRITPPKPEVYFTRPTLNLAIVIDRSGSMEMGNKMEYAQKAASVAVEALLPTDRVSITIFDDHAITIFPNGFPINKPAILASIAQIVPRGGTDLFRGYSEGGKQTEANLVPDGLNRILLVSDGRANVGVVDPNTLAQEAQGLASRGVSTTTLGVGIDYNEDLLEAMARSGEGNYYYIQSPVQLIDMFQTELQGLMSTVGDKVTLGLEPAAGVTVSEVLNDYPVTSNGRLQLSNLVIGMPLQTVIRLTIPAQSEAISPLAIHLAWNDPSKETAMVLAERIAPLQPVTLNEWSASPAHPDVVEQEALLLVARDQRQASDMMQQGDLSGTRDILSRGMNRLAGIRGSEEVMSEMAALNEMDEAIDANELLHFMKSAKYRARRRMTGTSTPPTDENNKP